MASTDQLRKHAALVDRMASARGVDLEEAALRGRITPGEISDAVLSCTACTHPEDCQRWLDSGTDPEGAAPEYCRNADLFTDLKKPA